MALYFSRPYILEMKEKQKEFYKQGEKVLFTSKTGMDW